MGLIKEFRDYIGGLVQFPGDFLGAWGLPPAESGVQVTELNALSIPAYCACIRIIADAVATLPLKIYDESQGYRIEAKDHPLARMLLLAPNPEVSAFDFRRSAQAHLLLAGNAYIEVIDDAGGRPAALYLRSPFRTFPYRTQSGQLFYRTNDTPTGSDRMIEASQMIHIKGLGLDPLVGLSPVKFYMREPLGTDLAAQSFAAKYFKNSGRPSGYLKVPGIMKNDAKLEALKSWIAGHTGQNANMPAILDGGMTWESVTATAEEAQFLQTRQFSAKQIAAIFGVPSHLIGDDQNSPKATLEMRNAEFLSYTLNPWLRSWEQAFNLKLFAPIGRSANKYSVHFDTHEYHEAIYLDTVKGVQMMRYAGIMSAQEGRAKMGLPPYTDAQRESTNPEDKLWQPVNMADVSDPDDQDAESPANNPPQASPPKPKGGMGGDPAGTPGPNKQPSGQQQAHSAPLTPDYRRIQATFGPLFTDALGRIKARSKPSDADWQRTFAPLIRAVLTSANREMDVAGYISGLIHRAATQDIDVDAEISRLAGAPNENAE